MIEARVDNRIGWITLNRPESHNSLDLEAMASLRTVFNEWADQDVRAVVLTGTGKSFCSGVALDVVATTDWSNNPLTALCDTIENFQAPVICAFNGGAYGGGVELAMACDFRVGVRGMKMFVPAAQIGIHYDPVGIARTVQKLGAQMARRVFLLAERFDDTALKDCAFLDYLVEADELEAETKKLAQTLSGWAPMAVRGMKISILEISRGNLDSAAAAERIAESLASDDHREGLAAMKEKRSPIFRDK